MPREQEPEEEPEASPPPAPEPGPERLRRPLRLPLAVAGACTVLMLALLVVSQTRSLRLGGGLGEGNWGGDVYCLRGLVMLGGSRLWSDQGRLEPVLEFKRIVVDAPPVGDSRPGALLFPFTPWHGEFRLGRAPLVASQCDRSPYAYAAVPLLALLPLPWVWPLGRWWSLGLSLRRRSRDRDRPRPWPWRWPRTSLASAGAGACGLGVALWGLAVALTPELATLEALPRLDDTVAEALARPGLVGTLEPSFYLSRKDYGYEWRCRGYEVEGLYQKRADGTLVFVEMSYRRVLTEVPPPGLTDEEVERLLVLNATRSPWVRHDEENEPLFADWRTADGVRRANRFIGDYGDLIFRQPLPPASAPPSAPP